MLLCPASLPAEPVKSNDTDILAERLNRPWKGDLDGMLERGFIRVLTARNPIFFAINGIEQHGLLIDTMRVYEKALRKKFGAKAKNLSTIMIVAPRDQLLAKLNDGYGDLIAANLTITAERSKSVSFTAPLIENVREVIVSGPAGKNLTRLDDLVTTGIMLRPSSSYFAHLVSINRVRKLNKRKVIPITPVTEVLEDYDLLEMVNAGLLPAAIVDDHKAKLWAKIFTNLRVHQDLFINQGGQIAWAMRQDNPQLMAATNGFLKSHKWKTNTKAVLQNRYLKKTRWLKYSLSKRDLKKYRRVLGIIKKYANRYNFDWQMIAAQGYQESTLDQKQRNRSGAIGIMQILPSTAADRSVGIKNIEKEEQNIHAGVKYLHHLRQHYYSKPNIDRFDQILFALAAYNAGPGNVHKAQRRAKKMGFDPNRWFGHVETAMARAVSREPVIYIRHILKYYIAYKNLAVADAAHAKMRGATGN